MSNIENKSHNSPAIPGMTDEGEKLATEQVQDDTIRVEKKTVDTSRAGRPTSYKVEDFAELTGREEDWRFTPLKRLGGLHTDALTGQGVDISVSAPDSVSVETVNRDDSRIGSAGIPEDRVAANAWSSFSEATVITVGQEDELDQHIALQIQGTSMEPTAQHIVVETKPFSKAVVALRHAGSAVVSQNVEFKVGDSSSLTVVSVQEWNDDAIHASAQYAKLGRDARFKHINISLGGNLVRVTPSTKFSAPGAETEMYGLYFVDAGQHIESRLFVDHSVPNCKSRVTYKGALQGRNAHSVWVGDVLIGKDAEGTDTYELNRNLILEDGPRADSVPNLEIETGLIDGAGHASTTGQLDDEHLWYLQARGIPEAEARRLVVRGFLNEIIQQIHIPELEEKLMDALEEELALSNN
ncbi:Fe-S cluster assembly protein SufD [Rothia amarae]|uniref:Fe-S cluster assembly protein SufD n=1 Tax=Rothia amarae TaxID=169480 RepID=A0A7H2BHB6_9MICC|nr:Fe-S cluster assembly protein SufD [Rothia amarae]QNV39062.1 Fe-S cluster assembly protein SufD [Rothia amarae]